MAALLLAAAKAGAADGPAEAEAIRFPSGSLTLGGDLFKPSGPGPFPAVLYNHGSAPGMLNRQASGSMGPLFAAHGWVFFMPYRRGQGSSGDAGRYIGDEIKEAGRLGGVAEAAATMTRLLATDHLQDQLAALKWLRRQPFVQAARVAVAGNSFGGVEAVLGAASAPYCAAVDAAGGAESWREAPELRERMTAAVRVAQAPLFFFQAENDFDLAPSRVLFDAAVAAGHEAVLQIYPAYGSSSAEGHSFAYRATAAWFPDVLAFLERHCPAKR